MRLDKPVINIYEFQGTVTSLKDNSNPTNKATNAVLVIDIPEIYKANLRGLFGNATGKVFEIVMHETEPSFEVEEGGI